MKILFTIGYEGSAIDDFVATLRQMNIQTLIDVRDVPLSRRPGFSKKALSGNLESAAINYIHMPSLGDPKPGREAARLGNYAEFELIFRAHLANPDAQAALEEIADLAWSSNTCLFCYERNQRHCHRLIIAEEVVKLQEFSVSHLGVQIGLAKKRRRCDEEFRSAALW